MTDYRGNMRSIHYENLSWLIGEKLKIIKGIEYQGGYAPDGDVMIIADFPNTILLEMTFIRSRWWVSVPPRKIKQLIPKAALACGDVVLSRIHGGLITQDMISAKTKPYFLKSKEELV